MLDWITGQREPGSQELTNDTLIDLPETPAPIFAVRAFKHALFGTPKPEEDMKRDASTRSKPTKSDRASNLSDRFEQLRTLDDRQSRNATSPPKNSSAPISPTKPASIMMTPRAASSRRKNVVFGEGVVDNEGKKPMLPRSRTGLPNDCPGKFPSPYTPKEKQLLHTKSTTLMPGSRSNGIAMTSKSRARSRDDADITLDLMEPRSESGRHWKELHTTYAQQSERQVRKLITKHKLAKQFAKAKDAEATEAKMKLESERKKFRSRSKELEDQLRAMKDQLRTAMAENFKSSTEVALLRKQLLEFQRSPPDAMVDLATDLHSVVPLGDVLPKISTPRAEVQRQRNLTRPSRLHRVPPRTSSAGDKPLSNAALPTTVALAFDDKQDLEHEPTLPFSPTTFPSPDAKALSSPAATPTFRSGRSTASYRVTKRPITVTIAKAKPTTTNLGSLDSPSLEAQTARAPVPPESAARAKRAAPKDDDDDDDDLWNLTDLDTAAAATRPSRQNKPSSAARTTKTATPGSMRPSRRADAASLADFPALLTAKERRANDLPRHFPGSPAVAHAATTAMLREPLTTGVDAGNAQRSRAPLPGKVSEASMRLAARRAGKGKAPLNLRGGGREDEGQENGFVPA